MKSQRHFWSSPEFWLFSSCLCALIGIVVTVIGAARHDSTLKTVGLYLMSPFAVCMAIVTFVLIPVCLYANWKRKRGGIR
jgi:hypothetical protein